MAAYLLSGVSGAGKTTIGNELVRHGYTVINTDEVLGYNGNIFTGEPVTFPAKPTREWFKDNGWIWNGDKLRDSINSSRGDVFFSGGSRNEARFYPLFTKIFLIHASDKQLAQRLQARHDPRTSNDLHIQRMIEMNQNASAHAAKIGATIIETDVPVAQSMQQILDVIRG